MNKEEMITKLKEIVSMEQDDASWLTDEQIQKLRELGVKDYDSRILSDGYYDTEAIWFAIAVLSELGGK